MKGEKHMRRSPAELFRQTKQLTPIVPQLLDAIDELMKTDTMEWRLQLAKNVLELTGYANMSVAAATANIPPSRIQTWLGQLEDWDTYFTFWHVLCSYPDLLEKALATTEQEHWLRLDKLLTHMLSKAWYNEADYDVAGIYSAFLGGRSAMGAILCAWVQRTREDQTAAKARQKKDEDLIGELTNFVTLVREKANALLAPPQVIEPGPHDEICIEPLDFSVRTYNCLKRAGLLTVGDIRNFPPEEILKIRNFGRKSRKEVDEKLGALDIQIQWPKEEDDEEYE
jgi:hypothetical protein